MRIPGALRAQWRREPEWLARLPQLVDECAALWELDLEEPFDTPHSFVAAAGDVVLKLNAPSHFEADHEASALECWAGQGAVRLVARDDERRALLIERCRAGTALADASVDPTAVVAELLPRLWLEPSAQHPFRAIGEEAERWAETLPRRYDAAGRPFERSLVSFALDVFRSVDATARVLVNQDLHERNILRAQREPWLVIDPKPAVGEREVSAVGLLRNAALRGGSAAVRQWLDVLEALDLDRERLRGWGVAHALAWGEDADGRWQRASVEAARTIMSSP